MFEILLQAAEINNAMLNSLHKDSDTLNIFKLVKVVREYKERMRIAKNLIYLLKILLREDEKTLNMIKLFNGKG